MKAFPFPLTKRYILWFNPNNPLNSRCLPLIMQVLRCLPSQENAAINLTISLGRGGEACVYAVPSDTNSVAKVYHKPNAIHARKLQAMLANPPENPTANLGHISIAWPQDLLRQPDQSDRIIGFLMPRIRGMRPVLDFYNPKTRRHCPLFSYQYLLRTARNLASAFAALHASDYCIGDVNESNILVSDTALVTLVDTDSFQVRDQEQNIVYRCQVGKPEFTPPELQNKVFAQHDRAIAHDLFGLGVLIFQLLMEGTHPFSGIYQGDGEPPTYEARIAAGHFTYSQQRRVPYSPTPIAPPWEILHPSLQELFLRCFEDGHNNPLLRPNAQTWLLTLAEAEESLVACDVNPQHRHSKHLHSCPWCERTLRLGGRDPFPSPQAIESKEHLQPFIKPRRRSANLRKSPEGVFSFSPNRSWQSSPTHNFSYYQTPKKKGRLYPVILCLAGFGLLGYLDIVSNFSRQLMSNNTYTQQKLISHKDDSSSNLSFAEYYTKGHAAYKVKNYEQAAEQFSHAIKNNPSNAKAHMNRGNARFNMKDYEGALADYTQALTINPNEVKAYVNRGNVRYTLAEYNSDPDKQYNLAIADFNNAPQQQ
jgi:DNA-binding helix-hairpin-helix protein with protein kinase domain